MSKRSYIPARGDVVHMNFGITAGREFDGPHYALVISHDEFQHRTGLCIVLPTTSKLHPELGALAMKLPPLEGLTKDGWALVHHVRSIDFRERSASLAARIDLQDPQLRQFVDELVDRLFSTVD